MTMTRRQALLSGAALPLAAPAAIATLAPTQVKAEAHMANLPSFRDFTLGDFTVTTLLAGSRTVEAPHEIFGLNASDEEFAAASEAAHIPNDKAQFFFTPTLVNTGTEVILFDTGLNAAGIGSALNAAGYQTDDVTHVVITHMHGDHIGGLMEGETPTFANATYFAGQTEFDYWAGEANDSFEAKIRPLAEQLTFIGDGQSVRSGVTAMEAFGHTPGHMVYMLESGGQQLLLMADTANHYVYSLAYPDWEVSFDIIKDAAAETRKRLLGMAAADGIPLIGYHMPFPGMGYVDTRGEGGFQYVPHSYQLML